MKKAIITIDKAKKISNIPNNCLLVLPKKDKELLKSLSVKSLYISRRFKEKLVLFLNFQSLINTAPLCFINCLRYSTYNNTVYNKMYLLALNSKATTVIDSLPFVFNRCNLWVIQKLLDINKYHPKQYYDNDFYDSNGIQANSIESAYHIMKDYLYTDMQPINFITHTWQHSDTEHNHYENFKRELIYEKNYPKIKVVTWLQGTSNRFDSKLNALQDVLSEIKGIKPIIIYNWDKGINEHKSKINYIVEMVSYHQKTNDTQDDVLFFETIISQKIKFYEKLAQYSKCKLHFFINPKLGADKKVVSETVDILNELNTFTTYKWRQI